MSAPRKPKLIVHVLELFDRMSQQDMSANRYAERALFQALSRHVDRLPKLDYYFHKAFRQVDVTGNGHDDMVIWCLLNQSELFWGALKAARKERRT